MNRTKNIVITFEEARKRVVVEISKTDPYSPDLVLEIIDEDTIEKEWGWIFYYDSAAHLRSGDIKDAIAGNAPIFVNRSTGELVITGTAWPIDKYIEDYETRLLAESVGG
jgi:hypothetical protein